MRLSDVKGVGAKTLNELNENGIIMLEDLFKSFPVSYKVFEIEQDNIYKNEIIYLEGIIATRCAIFKFRGRSYAITFSLQINENTRIKCILFSLPNVAYSLKMGLKIGIECKYNPKEKCFNVRKVYTSDLGFRIEPIYKIGTFPNNTIRRLMSNAFTAANPSFLETLPEALLKKYGLLDIKSYIYKSHFPLNKNDIIQVIRRRKYEEFFWYSIELDLIGSVRFNSKLKPRITSDDIVEEFVSNLKFKLTVDQMLAINDITADLKKDYSMNRLIQGDVGCGKTIVAIITALLMVKSGYQVALMAPTEVLAGQEYKEFESYLSEYGVRCALLTSSVKGKNRGEIVGKLSQGNIDVIVGTHALIEDSVVFNRLGLAIIDEQHRFGVNQRLKLTSKHKDIDCLFLTATPIPRTLGLTFFSELDITSIHSMPSERKQILTKVLGYDKFDKLAVSIKNHLALGEQCYVVVPLITENDELSYIDIDKAYEMFKEVLPDYKIAIMHGKLSSDEKNSTMESFKKHEYDILISTTVIEVGVNVPNATMMIIMDAERFGLSTLHQLRGRVGRGAKESFCMLVTNDVLNPRLNIIAENSDGFKISEEDFNLRGPGDYLGVMQSGFEGLKFSSFTDDIKILECAKNDSKVLIEEFTSGRIKNSRFNEIITSKNQKSKIN